jgi:hypothetical protein
MLKPPTSITSIPESKRELLYPKFEKLSALQQCITDEFAWSVFLANTKLGEIPTGNYVPLRTIILAERGIDWVIDQVTAQNTPYSDIREYCLKKFPPGR